MANSTMMANSGTGEVFEYENVTAIKTAIEGELEAALSALRSGALAIEEGFGEGGVAMTGGSSNVISQKWAEMEQVIVAFRNYLNNTLTNVSVVSKNTQALEDEATALFGGESMH